MDKKIAITKLRALRNTFDDLLAYPPYVKNFDPQDVMDAFLIYEPIRDWLIDNIPSKFCDLPRRPTPEPTDTTDFDGRGLIKRRILETHRRDIDYCLNILPQDVESGGIPSMSITREGVFFAGEYFDALKYVSNIIPKADDCIVLIDGYVDENTLALFTKKSDNVSVKVLTKKCSPSLKVSAEAFNRQYGGLRIRTSKAFHDRFLFLDDSEFYHFGASIKDLGNRGFMFSRIEETEVIEALNTKFGEVWESANVAV